MRAITAKEYEDMSPRDKGYGCYMQAAWNKNIKDENPFPAGSQEAKEFSEGSMSAYIDVLDSE
jgi:hypothetical protein